MAVVLGTNAGFVTTAPTADPASTSTTCDNTSRVVKDTSPATAAKIIEIGWWDSTAGTEEANFEVGLYAADGAVVPGEAGTRLFVDATNAKGTSGGWHVVTGLNWTISPSTAYWIGMHLDNTATSTNIDYSTTGASGRDVRDPFSSLPNPFGGGAILDIDGAYAIYAVWEAGEAIVSGMKINIGDSWKLVSGMWVNIGDAWKVISGMQVNIGDVWKNV